MKTRVRTTLPTLLVTAVTALGVGAALPAATRGHWDNYSCAPGRGGMLHHLWSNR